MLFWVFGASIAGTMLVMALTGRIDGGIWLRIPVASYALVWLASVSAQTIALWLARDLPRGVNLITLRRGHRPDDPVASRVWWWMRANWYGWLAVFGFLGGGLVLSLIGVFAE